jgi:hypothetical protein
LKTSSAAKTRTFNQAALENAIKMAELVASKQHDYGQDNILKSPYGVEQGLVTRLSDKIWRLKNLTSTGTAPTNESLLDTAEDIMGYGMVLMMYLKGEFELPLEPVTPVER